ncbi:N-sulfoglucosamine sulfohydrolase (sulfamidase), isoform CRA_e [Mus musculus]|uniref:N-sulfoglucosamine sulfohydrolase (sulfamidase) n=1 Tax=Mus musculus TaxID=10090 RepID=G3XA02_MOUSE|nr:N-sulfoglucosamine sulfohydrolase (sulfamidase), isoform CRA_e [Mus musculus]
MHCPGLACCTILLVLGLCGAHSRNVLLIVALSSVTPSRLSAAVPRAVPASSPACPSIRMACMGCTRMCITSTLLTRYRAFRCCSTRPECAQASLGRSTWVRRRCIPLTLHSQRRTAL